MRLRKLKIKGFKSFADKTLLEFKSGITAIVGPNGCGKSNIADAFRWVLGEQSAKSMRGAKMNDVIFGGSSLRQPLPFAEVSLTLSDIAGALPIPYDEITVTRRLHRSGESEYFLNDQIVRLKDLQDLLLDSGIGKNSLSTFEQGKVDQVIHFSPMERRSIFEEAAGIVRFLQRKRETLRKLESADGNIARLKDIQLEVAAQASTLHEQAAKAKQWQGLQGEITELEKGLLIAKWKAVQAKSESADNQEKEHKDLAEALEQQEKLWQNELAAAKQELEAANESLRCHREELFGRRSEKEIKLREKQHLQERQKELLAKERQWRNELETLLEQKEWQQDELAPMQQQQKDAAKGLAMAESKLQKQKAQAVACEQQLTHLRQKQQQMQQQHVQLMQKESQLSGEIKQNKVRLETVQERQAQLANRKQGFAQQEADLTLQLTGKERQVQEISATIDRQRDLLHSLEEKIQALKEEIENNHHALNAASQEMAANKARYKLLCRLREEMEGLSPATKRLLQEAANGYSPFYGKLKVAYELIIPKAGRHEAVAAALSTYGQTLVVESVADFHEVLVFAAKLKLKDFSLICRELTVAAAASRAIAQGEQEHSGSPLTALVEECPLSTSLLEGIYLADNLSEALQEGAVQASLLADENIFIDRHKVYFQLSPGSNNSFMREAEIKTLETALQELESKQLQLDAALKGSQQQLSQYRSEMLDSDKNVRRNEMNLVENNFALQRLNSELEKLQREKRHVDEEWNSSEATTEKLSLLLDELQSNHVTALNAVESSATGAAELTVALQHHSELYSAELALLQQCQDDFQQGEQTWQQYLHSIKVIELKAQENLRQEMRLREELELSQEHLSTLSAKINQFDTLLKTAEEQLSAATEANQQLEERTALQKNHVQEKETQWQLQSEKTKRQAQECYQRGILTAQLRSATEALQDEALERYEQPIQDLESSSVPLQISIEKTEKQLRSLRTTVETAGPVNMTAIEECHKWESRSSGLKQQINDMTDAKQELLDIIAKLDSDSRQLFQETFNAISANFKKNFAILFNGGEAELQLTAGSDLLEAGIEIIAKPPGKQMRAISLLSGGEKCLTAMALLFAIFEVKAGPFCILDEIDAPLDDSNVERFAAIVKQFIDRCQFIIITHNKCTMAIADTLFGVSMEEKGISKLLQLQFSHESEPQLLYNN